MDVTDMMKRLGKRIRKYRKKVGWSQNTLAEQAKLSTNYLGQLERGQKPNVTFELIVNLANALHISVSDLLEDIDVDDPSDMDAEDFANAIFRKKIEDACYPSGIEGIPVTTLLQFLAYLPLLQPEIIIDTLMRIGGHFEENEAYVLKQINRCIDKIPASDAKTFAKNCAEGLGRDAFLRERQEYSGELSDKIGYDEYTERMKKMMTFFGCYRTMMDTGI